MKTIFLYLCFIFYMIGSLFKRLKLTTLRKKNKIKEANEYLYISVRNWARFVINYIGLNLEVEGLDKIPKETCLFVANHQSNLDVPSLLSVVPMQLGFIAKIEMKNLPIISYWMKQIKCVFMDRENVREAVKSINEGIEYLKEGNSLLIFPEGTRSRGGEVKEFKKGSLKLGIKAGVPIVPVCVNGTYKSLEESGIKKSKAKITFCDPIYIKDLSKDEINNLHNVIRENIIKNM